MMRRATDNNSSAEVDPSRFTAFCAPMSIRLARGFCVGSWRRLQTSLRPRGLCSTRRGYLNDEEERIVRNARIWTLRPDMDLRMTADAVAASVPGPSDTSEHSLLDGKATAATIRSEIASHVEALVSGHGESARPSLAVVIVGTRPDSMTYVRSKHRACEEVGISSHSIELDENVSQSELESVVSDLNKRDDIHGILIQLPLPAHIDEERVLDLVNIEKDVDGFHPLNIGRLCMSGRKPPLFVPCTPRAVLELLDRYGVALDGQRAVVIGRSNIVGLPTAMLLMHRNATVTICHSRTVETERYVRDADVVIAACGIANFIKGDWIKPGAVVVDVGINAVDDKSRKKGYRLVGDVEFETAAGNASLITPVPGGVGPMTIAMLLSNTLTAARRRTGA